MIINRDAIIIRCPRVKWHSIVPEIIPIIKNPRTCPQLKLAKKVTVMQSAIKLKIMSSGTIIIVECLKAIRIILNTSYTRLIKAPVIIAIINSLSCSEIYCSTVT